MRPLILLLIVLSFGSCNNRVPVLGTIDDAGYYHDAAQRFSLPIPGRDLGFHDGVEIVDAQPITETYKPHYPYGTQRPAHIREDRTYTRILGYRPKGEITFTDQIQPDRKLRIIVWPQRNNPEHPSIYTAGFKSGNLGLIKEKISTDQKGRKVGIALLQLPYWPIEQAISGMNFHHDYFINQKGPPKVIILANIIVKKIHYQVRFEEPLRTDSDSVNIHHLESVHTYIKSHADLYNDKWESVLNIISLSDFSEHIQ